MFRLLWHYLTRTCPDSIGVNWTLYGPTSQGVEYRCRHCALRWWCRGFWDTLLLHRDRHHKS